MIHVPFSESELEIIGSFKGGSFIRRESARFRTPATPLENYNAMARRDDPLWMPNSETLDFCPSIFPDNIARGAVSEAVIPAERGGLDMFGLDWEFMESAGGSMVKQGLTLFDDVNDWESKVVFPDIESWDWSGCAERNKDYLADRSVPIIMTIFTGCFERLISFMGFENAAIALIDDDQKEAVQALFTRLFDLYICMIDKSIEYFHPTGIVFHDDWGSQMAPFFSKGTYREMILPHMQRIVAYCHEKGLTFELHSCGHTESMIEEIIKIGADMWRPQPMNDIHTLYRNWGDKISFGVLSTTVPMGETEEENIRAAQELVRMFSEPGKYVYMAARTETLAFRKALYEASRKAWHKG